MPCSRVSRHLLVVHDRAIVGWTDLEQNLAAPSAHRAPCTYPHTIENGAGERLAFLRRVPGASGDRLEVENLKERGGTAPDPFDAAFLIWRYRSEFTMVEIPAAVQRFVFALQVAIGHALGKYRKFADAPAPVRRWGRVTTSKAVPLLILARGLRRQTPGDTLC